MTTEVTVFTNPKLKWLRYRSWLKRGNYKEIINSVRFRPYTSDRDIEKTYEFFDMLAEKYGIPFDVESSRYFIRDSITVDERRGEVIERREAKPYEEFVLAERVKVKGYSLIRIPIPCYSLWFYAKCYWIVTFYYHRTVEIPLDDSELIMRACMVFPFLAEKHFAKSLRLKLKGLKKRFKKIGREIVILTIPQFGIYGELSIFVPMGVYKCLKCNKGVLGVYASVIHEWVYHQLFRYRNST